MKPKLIRDTDTAQFEPPIIHRWDHFGVRWWIAASDDELFGRDYSIILLTVGGCPLKTLMKPRTRESFHSFMHRWEPAFCVVLFQLHSSLDLRRFHEESSSRGSSSCSSAYVKVKGHHMHGMAPPSLNLHGYFGPAAIGDVTSWVNLQLEERNEHREGEEHRLRQMCLCLVFSLVTLCIYICKYFSSDEM